MQYKNIAKGCRKNTLSRMESCHPWARGDMATATVCHALGFGTATAFFSMVPSFFVAKKTACIDFCFPHGYSAITALKKWSKHARKPQGCLNGDACLRCHLCPAGELKRRKGEQKASLNCGSRYPCGRPQ